VLPHSSATDLAPLNVAFDGFLKELLRGVLLLLGDEEPRPKISEAFYLLILDPFPIELLACLGEVALTPSFLGGGPLPFPPGGENV